MLARKILPNFSLDLNRTYWNAFEF